MRQNAALKLMNILSVCAVALITAIVSRILKNHLPEYAPAVSIAGGIIITACILPEIFPAVNQIKNLLSQSNLPAEYGAILFKCLGICLVSQFASNSCSDAGESALACKIEFAGKLAVTACSLPLFEKIVHTAITLAGGK